MIWHRLLLKPLIQTFLFCLGMTLFLYILVDLSVHGVHFSKTWSGYSDLIFYYLKHLSIHWDLFATISFLLASLKVLSDAAIHLEWSALQMGGLSSRRLLLPFVFFACFLALLSLVNGEWVSPSAGKVAIELSTSKKKHLPSLHSLLLEDGSELVYAKQENGLLHDLFWIKNRSEIWHLETFSSKTQVGTQVDLLEIQNGIHSKDHFDELYCSGIELPSDWQQSGQLALEWRSISSLFKDPSPEGRTYLHRKLAEPLLPLLSLIAIAPPLLRFQRRPRLFLITALSLLGFFIQLTIFEGLQILGENRVCPPSIAIWAPLLAAGLIFGARFRKI